MSRTNSPLHQLILWATSGADDRRGRQTALRWGALRPALSGYASVGDLVRSGWVDANRAAALIRELTAVSDQDGLAIRAALAILAPRLAGVVTRWARGGVPAGDLDDLESELLVETIGWLRSRPEPAPPGVIVDRSWAAVRAARRRRRRALSRQAAFDPAGAVAGEPPAALTAAAMVVDGYRSGRLSLPAAQALWATGVAGWSGRDAARWLGCRPDALRARRARAIRTLAA